MVDPLQMHPRQATAFRPASPTTGNGADNDIRGTSLPATTHSNGILGEAAAMRQLQLQLQHLAATSSNVLIYGEPGTGKHLIARTIHSLSDGAAAVATVSCSEGVKAVEAAMSRLTHSGSASSGAATLIVDGLADLSPAAQAELVQVLEGPANARTDGHQNGHRAIKPRILAIFAGDAERAFAEGVLNREAMQHLAPLQLAVPALREREDDAVLLAQYFLALLNSEEGTAKTLSGESLLFLRRATWPGNVRELRGTVQRAFFLADRELQVEAAVRRPVAGAEEPALRIVVGTSLEDAEKRMIAATLKKCGGNKTRAAALLGVSLKTLYNRLNGYRAQGLELTQFEAEITEVAV